MSSTKYSPTSIDKPDMPVLQSLLYWIAALTLIGSFSVPLMTPPKSLSYDPSDYYVAQIIITVIGIIISVLIFGLGQLIGYLGQTAHYTRSLCEIMLATNAPAKGTTTTESAVRYPAE